MKIFDLDSGGAPCGLEGPGIRVFDLDDEKRIDVYLPGPAGPSGISRPFKAGLVAGGSFSGSPKKTTIAFTTPFDDDNYTITLGGTDSRNYTYESKTASGFVINANASAAIVGEVSWTSTSIGESS